MDDRYVMNKLGLLCNAFNEIIFWCDIIECPLYDTDENGERVARDLFQIRDDFTNAYNNMVDKIYNIERTTNGD